MAKSGALTRNCFRSTKRGKTGSIQSFWSPSLDMGLGPRVGGLGPRVWGLGFRGWRYIIPKTLVPKLARALLHSRAKLIPGSPHVRSQCQCSMRAY